MSELKIQKFDSFESWRQKANNAVQQLLDLTQSVSLLSQNSTTNVGDLDTLQTAVKTSIVGSINSIVTQLSSLSGLLGNTDNLATADKDSVVEAINEVSQNLNTFKLQVINRIDNKEINSGRFSSDSTSNIIASVFSSTNALSIQPDNSSVFSEGDKFINDNLTNGGVQAALNQNISDLLVVMERIDKRYGLEFLTLKVTAGTGTTSPIVRGTETYYRMVKNSSYVTNGLTQSFWFRVTAETIGGLGVFLDGVTRELYINGLLYSNGKEIKISDGWVFVEVIVPMINDVEFIENSIPMYGNDGNVVHIATLGLFDGSVLQTPFKGIKI